MASYTKSAILVVVSVLLVSAAVTTAVAKVSDEQKTIYQNDPETVYDDGSVDNALLNYLFARQMVNRLRNHVDPSDLQRKRSGYWKQCAFNAVSCFGKK